MKFKKQEGQIIEVDYDEKLVKKYSKNYIMEEEGIGATLEAEPFDTQTKLNEVPFQDMIEEGQVIMLEEVEDNDKKN